MNGALLMFERISVALGTAIVQSLWQCALVGSVGALIVMATRRASVRYCVWSVAMVIGFVWFALTIVSGMRIHKHPVAEMAVMDAPSPDVLFFGIAAIEQTYPFGVSQFAAIGWLVGFMFVTLRFARQWFAAWLLRSRGVSAAGEPLEAVFNRLLVVFGLSGRVRVVVSSVVESPMVVGWIAPVVVVPASVVTMLSPEQVRLVLAHELAHIRRYDHLVNMLQVLVESVMFYHPVIWWISRQVRVEREHCCDDAAVRVCGDAVSYARALTELETIRVRSRAVLGLHHGGSLMKRITRLLNESETRSMHGAVGVISVCALIAGAAYAHTAMSVEPVEVAEVVVGVELPMDDVAGDGEMMAFIRRHALSGVLSRAQAFELYRGIVEPTYTEDLNQIEAGVFASIEAGKISEEDGHARIDGEREGIAWEIERRFMMEIFGMSSEEAKLSMLSHMLDVQVGEGQLSREEADAKIIAATREILEQRVVVGVPYQVDFQDEAEQDSPLTTPMIGVPILQSLPLEVEGLLEREIDFDRRVVAALKLEIEALDAFVERNALSMDEAKAKYEVLVLKLREVMEAADAESVDVPLLGTFILVPQEFDVVAGGAGGAAGGGVGTLPVIKDAPVILDRRSGAGGAIGDALILRGVGADTLRSQQEMERGSFAYFEKNLRAGLLDSVRADVEAGRISKGEAEARVRSEERSQRFQARWMSVVHMYQNEVIAGRLTAEAANMHLREALDENGYFASEFAWDLAKGGMQIVEADHVFEVMVTPDGKPVGGAGESAPQSIEVEPISTEGKLTPMDDAYWLHQGIRPMSAYDESFEDDC